MSIPLRQTISAEALRSRILATVSESPALTAYEVAAVLGYGKPESRRVAEIVQRLWDDGALVADNAFRPAMGRQARIFFVAPAGTRPRRARNRAGKPGAPRGAPHLTTLRPAAASIGRDSERAACRDADPELSSGPAASGPRRAPAAWRRQGPTASPAQSAWPASMWPNPTGRHGASGAAPTWKPSALSAPRKRPGQVQEHPAGPDPHRSSTPEGIGNDGSK